MFVHLVVSTLILGSVVAVPPPTAEVENQPPATTMTDFRCNYKLYEEHNVHFLVTVEADLARLENVTSRKLFEELKPYIASLPKGETRLVTKKYREKCWCDGSVRSPCPEKCMNSCRWFTDSPTFPWKNENDCEGAKSRILSCYCYKGSSSRCNYGNLSNCYDGERTEVEKVNKTCSPLRVDEKMLDKKFSGYFSRLTVGSIRWQLVVLAQKLTTFNKTVEATDSLFNVTYASCCEKRYVTPCYPETPNILNEKINRFVQLQRDIEETVILIQEKTAFLTYDTKKEALPGLQAKIKEYECCLKGLGYSEEDNECEAPGSSHSTLPSPSSPSPTTS